MSQFKSYGYTFGDLWAEKLTSLRFDYPELIEVINSISPEQYQVLINACGGVRTREFDYLLTEYYIIAFPEKAEKLFQRMARRNHIRADMRQHVEDLETLIQKQKERDEQRAREGDPPIRQSTGFTSQF